MRSFGPPLSLVSLSYLFFALRGGQHLPDNGCRSFNLILQGATDGTPHDAANTSSSQQKHGRNCGPSIARLLCAFSKCSLGSVSPALVDASPLHGEWQGCFRLRSGDHRVISRRLKTDLKSSRLAIDPTFTSSFAHRSTFQPPICPRYACSS